MTTSMSRFAAFFGLGLSLAIVAAPRPARACGGFFCDRPPPNNTLPIAQAGENVLFVLDQGQVEAHIQILYKGDAAQFSWVVPVTALPTLDVGSDVMFDMIEPATRPSFSVQWQMDGTCKGFGGDSGSGCGSSGGAIANGGAGKAAGGPGIFGGGVEVAFRGNVGPYDSSVVRSDDPAALKTWLTTNGYFVSDASSAIIDDYVAAHSYFVALRLQQGKDTSAIQPIVLRLASDEGCLPLKLTAIAATPDLRINVWVLADARAVPLDFVEVGVNLDKIDWFNNGSNYDKLLGEAADEAGGDAFAVEYARTSSPVAQKLAIPRAQIDQLATVSDPAAYLSTLTMLGLGPTGQVATVLRKDLPLPASLASQGVTEAQFYGNIYQFETSIPVGSFDPKMTTADLDAAVFTPLATVQPLFVKHPYLTRLATFISPEEMTKDPRFVTNADLPTVNPQHFVIAHMECGDQEYDVCHAPVRLRVETGDDVRYAVAAGAPADCNPGLTPNYDRTTIDTLPSSDVAWLRDATGEGHMVVDNRAAISMGLAAHNATVLTGGGCGCSVTGRGRPVVAALIIVGLLVARRRKSRTQPATQNRPN
jgi:MYXO-CTERM domain-containing protein